MGKPIAGQDQFPYTVGGFLVDGAKINGVTYFKKLYIYKQRSMVYYDLMDTSGKIYQFVKIGFKDSSGNILNYFDVDENLVQLIPDNTFFLKIQDPSREIFSFVRVYQWHKCITVEGDYVYRSLDIDPRLSGVLINPVVSTIQVGNSLSYKATFYPNNYQDQDGSWYMNSIDSLLENGYAKIINSEKNNATVIGVNEGKAVLTFVPKNNDSLVTHSIINVVNTKLSIEDISLQLSTPYDVYKLGEEYTIEVVTYPYDAVIDEPLTISFIEEDTYFPVEDKLLRISDDNKFYTFVSELTDGHMENDGGISHAVSIQFELNDPKFEVNFDMISIVDENTYNDMYSIPGIFYNFPPSLRPNMTYESTKYIVGPNVKEFEYTSSDDEIATFDYTTSTLTTHGKIGRVYFSTFAESPNGDVIPLENFATVNVFEEVYDYIILDPQQITTMNPGQSQQFTFTGYREGYEPQHIPVRDSFNKNVYVVDNDVVSIPQSAPEFGQVSVSVSKDITVDIQVLSLYRSPGASFRVSNPGTEVPMTEMYVSGPDNNSISYIKLNPDGYDNLFTILVYPRPYTCLDFQMEIDDGYDNTIVEVIDEDFLINTFQYSMGGTLYMYLKALKRGSTEMTIRSVHYPDVSTVLKIVVY